MRTICPSEDWSGDFVIAERDSVLHSWCVQSQWDAPTVVGGDGARLRLEDGRSILDMSSLAECSNLGHQHPRVVAAIRAQAEQLCFVTRAGACSSRSAVPTPTSTPSRSCARRWRGRGAW
jgi:taurine--2-oxoglutarate transaminase